MPNGSVPNPAPSLLDSCKKGFEHDRRLSVVEMEVHRNRRDYEEFRGDIKQEFTIVKADMKEGFEKIHCGMKELTNVSIKAKLMWSGLGTLLVLTVGVLIKVLLGA